MAAKKVLVLGNHSRLLLPNALKNLGFVPEVRGSVLHCLLHLRNQHVAAVVVDRDFTHADVLEVFLNIKDIDDSLTVIIVGWLRNDNVEQILKTQKQAVFVSETHNQEKLANELADILKNELSEN